MKILGIDTATSVASVALMDDDKLIGLMTLNDKKTHSQKLMVLVESLLKQTDHTFEDIDRIAVACGPGSFTGLRIGVTTAKALAHGAGKPVIEISSLKSLAYNLQGAHVCALMDARRDTVFAGIYGDEPMEDQQLHINELLEHCKNFDHTWFVGDGATKHQTLIKETLEDKALFAPKHLNISSAGSLCELALLSEDEKKYDDVHVTYLRKSQAEREYEEKQK